MFGRFLAWGKANPFAFGVGVATAKTAVADLLVQKRVERRENIDWRRVTLFTCFGFAYLGVFQYGLYVTAFKRMFPGMEKFAAQPFREKFNNKAGRVLLAKQVGFDCFIHPIWFFPIYYTMKENVQGDISLSFSENTNVALNKYKNNAWEDWTAFWKIWIVGDCVVMSLPLWARLPANHAISFVYVCVLSAMRGAPIDSEEDEKEAKVIEVTDEASS